MTLQLLDIYKTNALYDPSLNTIPVTGADATAWRFVYRVNLVDKLQPGDWLEVHAEHEFSNPGYDNTELVTAISVCNNGQWYDTDLYNTALHSVPTAGLWGAPPAGGNLNSQEHHRQLSRHGSFQVPDLTYTPYTSIIFRARARRDSPSGYIIIEPAGYGSMFVKHYRCAP